MQIRIPAVLIALSSFCAAQGFPVNIASPDGQVVFTLTQGQGQTLAYEVSYRGQPVIASSRLGLDPQNQPPLSANLSIATVLPGSLNETYTMKHGKANPLRAHSNTLLVMFEEQGGLARKLSFEVRVFNDGLGFRYRLPQQPSLRELRLEKELTQFNFAREGASWPLILSGFRTSYEDSYAKLPLTSIKPDSLVALPFLTNVPGSAWVAVTESHLENYAGMYLKRASGRIMEATLAPRIDDPSISVIRATPLETPWRVLLISDRPGGLVESNIVLHLAPPSRISDENWIKPGKTSWSWWSGDYATNVPFQYGMNTETMKHYIDFSAEQGLEYMMLDEGWSADVGGRPRDLTKTNPKIDMPSIMAYAKEKNVGIWLWCYWTFVDSQMDEAFPLFEKWGVKGVKIDFMDRDDQDMVNFYHRVMKKAAEHKLMVDFHGAYKPCGLRRYYPNLLTREAAMSLEYVKWSNRVTAEHNVHLAFTRMLAGPMDYTPGGFFNVPASSFVPRFLNPQVPTTRAHQVALYVVFESGFTMVADFPGAYKDQPETPFIAKVPVAWDETRVISGDPDHHIVIARRKGRDWYVGGITNADARDLKVALDFLPEGAYSLTTIADASNAAVEAAKTAITKSAVTRTAVLDLKLAPAGGFALHLTPAE